MKTCQFCAEEIQDAAIVCKHCGRDVSTGSVSRPATTVIIQRSEINPGVAAVLSLVIPGAGQMYSGRVVAGIIWLISVVIGYAMLVVPGLILHVLCVFSAYSGAHSINEKARRAA